MKIASLNVEWEKIDNKPAANIQIKIFLKIERNYP